VGFFQVRVLNFTVYLAITSLKNLGFRFVRYWNQNMILFIYFPSIISFYLLLHFLKVLFFNIDIHLINY